MNQLKVIEHKGQRVLTTVQLAEAYGAENDRISKNFHENKGRFKEGKHFFKLTGDDLLYFRNSEPQIELSNMARTLYLWTEKGAWMHAKSLNTDQAWDAYEMLGSLLSLESFFVSSCWNISYLITNKTP